MSDFVMFVRIVVLLCGGWLMFYFIDSLKRFRNNIYTHTDIEADKIVFNETHKNNQETLKSKRGRKKVKKS